MIIGFTGKKTAGKTSAAKFINEKYGYPIFSFADALKEMIVTAGMATPEEVYQSKPENVRWLLQKIGTDIIRNQINPNFWVDKMTDKIINCKEKIIIIDDIRFLNERKFVLDFNGVLIKIIRNNVYNNDTHQSEIEIDLLDCNHILLNNGSLDKLKYSTLKLINLILEEK